MKRLVFVLSLLFATAGLIGPSPAQFDDDATDEAGLVEIEDYGYFKTSSKWSSTEIPVCWENPDARFEEDMALSRQGVTESWEANSKVRFTGWGACPADNFVGIRILIADQWPHVKDLGAYISGMQAGMVLNFDYNMPEFSACNADEEIHYRCVRAIAVHEFGHALGLAHEHNRSDRDATCTIDGQGGDGDLFLTVYDADSVMNYCDDMYVNGGKLSDLDIKSIQLVYGAP